ncbi:MAG: hypothetical protein ACRDHZ_11995 [Ktedonobacteraceae bacterium]
MANPISYPTDDMSSTSKSLTAFLDDQWQQHTALFMTNHDSYATLLQAIAGVIPGAGSNAGNLAHALENYHQQYQQCYQALNELAVMIDQAAQAMNSEDQQVGNSFQ